MSEALDEYDDLLDGAEHRWRNRLIGLAVLGVLIALGAYALWATVLGGGGSSSAEIQTATVERGSISQTMSTTGVAVAQSTANLSFEQAGTVSAVNVTLGQEVKQGDILAEIDASELQSAVVAAEVNLDSAQGQLNDLLGGPTASDLASADQGLTQAKGSYAQAERALQDLLDGPSATELRSAEQAVAAAEVQLAKAEEARQNVFSDSEDAVAAAEDAVARAEDALVSAQGAVSDAADKIVTAKLSLLSAADTYCDTDDHLPAICIDFTVPLTDAEVRSLVASIAGEIGSTGVGTEAISVAGGDVQAAQGESSPTPEPQPTPTPQSEPTPTPEAEATPTPEAEATPTPEAEATATPQTETGTGNQTQAGSNIVQATTSLISANTGYKNALESKASAEEGVKSAEADLEQAQADLEEAKKGPSAEDIAAADVDVAAAQLSLDEAQANLDELKAGPTQDDLDDAQNAVDAAAAALTVAQAKWNDAYDGADAQDIEVQREQVRQAEEAVEKARENLDKAQIIAPFDGTVAELNVEVGDEVGTGGSEAAIILNTPGALRLQLSITESDVVNVEAGQTGIATFDALDNAAFPIEIESVGTNPTTTQGVVTYQAWATVLSAPTVAGGAGAFGAGSRTAMLATAAEILGVTEEELQAALQSGQTLAEIAEAHGMSADDFQAALMERIRGTAAPGAGTPEPTATPTPESTPSAEGSESAGAAEGTSAKPLPGMNASVTIMLDSAQDVLIVPESAVQTEGPNSVVEVQNDDGSTEKVTVQTGLSDGSNIEITEGLEEGQTVIVPTRVASSTTQTTQGGFPQGGFIISGEGGPPSGGTGPSFRSEP
jgi:multidrug efflux pump subunit AcrA (membrane-fusion protein)